MSEHIVKAALEVVVKNLNASSYTWEIVGQSGKEDGYGSDINFVRLTTKNKDDTNKVWELAIKCTKTRKLLEHVMKLVFKKEIFLYTEVKVAFEKLQESYGLHNLINFMPYCYGALSEPNYQALVLENLKSEGFIMANLESPWPKEGTLLAMEAYGKWHALSFALKTLLPADFQNLIKDNINVFCEVGSELKFFNRVVTEFMEVRNTLISKGSKVALKYSNYSEDDVRYALSDMFFEKECLESSVILHGDCWSNNFLLKFDNITNIPTDIRIMDWQCSGLASPVFDLSHHIFCTAKLEEDTDLNDFLKVYYESFSNTLASFNCSADNIFPYSKLLSHWKKFSRFGFFLGCFIIKFCFPKKTKFDVDYGKLKEDDNIEDMFLFEIENEDKYYERLEKQFLFYHKYAQ